VFQHTLCGVGQQLACRCTTSSCCQPKQPALSADCTTLPCPAGKWQDSFGAAACRWVLPASVLPESSTQLFPRCCCHSDTYLRALGLIRATNACGMSRDQKMLAFRSLYAHCTCSSSSTVAAEAEQQPSQQQAPPWSAISSSGTTALQRQQQQQQQPYSSTAGACRAPTQNSAHHRH
jgi:hypothetical protein